MPVREKNCVAIPMYGLKTKNPGKGILTVPPWFKYATTQLLAPNTITPSHSKFKI